jgi:hypothetical protein
MDKELEKLKEIVEANKDLKERISSDRWSISYNKDADMIIMGGVFPKGSFYHPVDDSGVLMRIDKNNRILGFAIEDTKYFIKQNPEMAFALNFVVHPYRTKYITIPALFIAYQTKRSLNNMKSILSVSDYVAGKAVFAE